MLDQHARGRIRRGKANKGRAAPVGAGQVPGKACAAGRIQGARLSGRLRLIIGVQHVARFGSGPHGRLDRVRFRPKLRQEHGRAVRGRADRVVSDVAWRARPVRRPPRAAAMPIGPGRPAHGLAPESCGCQIARQRRKRPRRLPPPSPATAEPSCRCRPHSRIRRWRSPQPPNPQQPGPFQPPAPGRRTRRQRCLYPRRRRRPSRRACEHRDRTNLGGGAGPSTRHSPPRHPAYPGTPRPGNREPQRCGRKLNRAHLNAVVPSPHHVLGGNPAALAPSYATLTISHSDDSGRRAWHTRSRPLRLAS